MAGSELANRSAQSGAAPANPFIIGQHATGEGFTDRVAEIDRFVDALSDSSTRLVVYGDRRLGKSSALNVAAERVRAAGRPVAVVDLGKANSAIAAAQRIVGAIYKEIGAPWEQLAKGIVARLRGAVTVTASVEPAGTSSFALKLEPGSGAAEAESRLVTEVLDAVEEELARRNHRIGLVLDEFQRLLAWGGEDVEWALKASFETHRHTAYIMAGSARRLIEDMVSKKRRALWGVVEAMEFGPIEDALMMRWIVDRSAATGVPIDVIVAATIVRLAGPRTRDIVQLARAVWFLSRDRGAATRSDVTEAMESLVDEQSPLHLRVWDARTATERRVLTVLAAEPEVSLLAAETLGKYDLGPKSTIQNAVSALVGDELLTRTERSGGFTYDDPFFRRWVEVNALEDINRTPPPLLPDEV
ncbi:MAG TPA: ATP-binding protein [Gemmatimonadaceae bacterium]|nr:ATP-binding protein [Gemmatimonadaceae bacterium]